MSPQVISCDHHDNGCSGGNTETAYEYLESSSGAVLAKDYPDTSHSTGSTGSCRGGGKPAVKAHLSSDCPKLPTKEHASTAAVVPSPRPQVKGYARVKGESSMAAYVGATGPLSICVDASR